MTGNRYKEEGVTHIARPKVKAEDQRPQEPKWEYGPYFKEARIRKKIKVEVLAATLNVTPRYVRSIEKGDSIPATEILVNLCKTLSLSLDSILYPEFTREEVTYCNLCIRLSKQDEATHVTVDHFLDFLDTAPTPLPFPTRSAPKPDEEE